MEPEPPVNQPRPVFHDPPFASPSSSPPSPPPAPPIAGREWARSPHLRRSPPWPAAGSRRSACTPSTAPQDGDDDGRGRGSSGSTRERVLRGQRRQRGVRAQRRQVRLVDLQAGRAGRRHDHVDDQVERPPATSRPSARPVAAARPPQGSGFVIDKQGRILTNAHVVEGATTVRRRVRGRRHAPRPRCSAATRSTTSP